jgi:hypothetical protein
MAIQTADRLELINTIIYDYASLDGNFAGDWLTIRQDIIGDIDEFNYIHNSSFTLADLDSIVQAGQADHQANFITPLIPDVKCIINSDPIPRVDDTPILDLMNMQNAAVAAELARLRAEAEKTTAENKRLYDIMIANLEVKNQVAQATGMTPYPITLKLEGAATGIAPPNVSSDKKLTDYIPLIGLAIIGIILLRKYA